MPGCTPSRSARLRCPAWSAVVLNAAPPVGDLLPRCASGLGGHLPAAMVATCPVVHTAGAGDASARPCDCAGCSPARAKLRRVARAAVHTVLNYRGILALVFHPVPAIRPGMTCFVVSAQPRGGDRAVGYRPTGPHRVRQHGWRTRWRRLRAGAAAAHPRL